MVAATGVNIQNNIQRKGCIDFRVLKIPQYCYILAMQRTHDS